MTPLHRASPSIWSHNKHKAWGPSTSPRYPMRRANRRLVEVSSDERHTMSNMEIVTPLPLFWVIKTPLIGRQVLSDYEFDDGFTIHLHRFSKAGFGGRWWTSRFVLAAKVHLDKTTKGCFWDEFWDLPFRVLCSLLRHFFLKWNKVSCLYHVRYGTFTHWHAQKSTWHKPLNIIINFLGNIGQIILSILTFTSFSSFLLQNCQFTKDPISWAILWIQFEFINQLIISALR